MPILLILLTFSTAAAWGLVGAALGLLGAESALAVKDATLAPLALTDAIAAARGHYVAVLEELQNQGLGG